MGVTVTWSPQALTDLNEIRDYLLPISPQGAESVRRAIAKSIDLLAQFPNAGRETNMASVRMLPIVTYPYLIYYTVLDSELFILHVRHGARASPGNNDIR